MLKLDDHKAIFAAVGFIGILLFASPILSLYWQAPVGEPFSELWILDKNQMIGDHMFNVEGEKSYLVYVGVGNHLHSSAYYIVNVKFRNQQEPLPDATAGTSSPLEPIYEYRIFLEDEKSWQSPLTFSFSEVSFFENQSFVGTMRINNASVNVNKVAIWDAKNAGYYYQLFIELWIYNPETEVFQFHNRYCSIWLNMTLSSVS